MALVSKLSRYTQSAFYIFAGLNHFINPGFYYPLIPVYLPFHEFINYGSGILEMVLGVGLLIPKTRKLAALGIVLMLIAFIPSHIYFIKLGSCIEGVLCVNPWVAWLRLVVIHPLLIWWGWNFERKIIKKKKI